MSAFPRPDAALIVIATGVCAALHVGKLAPAIATLQQALGMSLLQAGFLLSLVQGAGMTLGLALGALADRLGARRSMLTGMVVLGLASLAGGLSSGVPLLMALRALEGLGFLLVVLPAPGLLRGLVAPQRLSAVLGLWSTYMPLATALALLCGPLWLAWLGWRSWWWLLAAVSLGMAALLARSVPEPLPVTARASAWMVSVRQTLACPGPWLVAGIFATYSGQWLAVIGFLPTVYTQAGLGAALTAVLTALAAAANIVGNVAAGRALQRGVPAGRLLMLGFATMAATTVLTFASLGQAPWMRFAAVLLFSGIGGLIPGTLFSLALRVAPGEDTVASTVGWMQQWSALGQFVGPPAVAWVASQSGGWQSTWLATGACSVLGLVLTLVLAKRITPVPPLHLSATAVDHASRLQSPAQSGPRAGRP